jgi:hypothetical protein
MKISTYISPLTSATWQRFPVHTGALPGSDPEWIWFTEPGSPDPPFSTQTIGGRTTHRRRVRMLKHFR